MKAVVLAAGEGTRMRPLTATRPKPMLPVAGRPLLEHVLETCISHVEEIVLVVGYKADTIRTHFGDSYADVPITYVTQDEQLGTGHAIGLAEPHVDESFVALNGDIVIAPSLVDRLASASGGAMAVKPVDNPTNYGIVSHDETRVTAIIEKPDDPPSNLANLGIYRFPPTIFEHINELELSPRGELEITDAVQALIDDGTPVKPIEYDGHWLDIGRPWELLDANAVFLDNIERSLNGEIEPNATIQGPVVVENEARVRNGAYLEGPAIVQSGADVGPNCYVRGATVIGSNTRVGNAVEVKNSILMSKVTVPHHAYIGDSVLGRETNFGAGTKVANLRHDGATVRMRVKGERVDTDRHKLGVIAADNVKTGINTSLNPGVKLGPAETTFSGETIKKDRPSEND